MNIEINRYSGESVAERRVRLEAPEDYQITRQKIDQVDEAFRREYQDRPELRLVEIYCAQGKYALNLFASGSESDLHAQAKHWTTLMYPGEAIPKGHVWSISPDQNMGRVVVE